MFAGSNSTGDHQDAVRRSQPGASRQRTVACLPPRRISAPAASMPKQTPPVTIKPVPPMISGSRGWCVSTNGCDTAVHRPHQPFQVSSGHGPEPDRTSSGKPCTRNSVIDSSLAILMTVHLPPCPRVEKPVHQFRAVDAQRILQILIRPRTVAVVKLQLHW